MGLTDTSSGHVILAFRDDEERARMLAAHSQVEGELEIDFPQLSEALEDVRERGYERMTSRQTRGVTNIALPVFSSSGYPWARSTCLSSSASIAILHPTKTRCAT